MLKGIVRNRLFGVSRAKYEFFGNYARLLDLIGVEYLAPGSAEEADFYRRLDENFGSGK